MLEVTGGAAATLIPANTDVDWPAAYLASELRLATQQHGEALVEQVCTGAWVSDRQGRTAEELHI